MDNIDKYIELFGQTPMAVILLVFIYFQNKQQTQLNKTIAEFFTEALKIIRKKPD